MMLKIYFIEKESKWMSSLLMIMFIIMMFISLELIISSKSYILEWNILVSSSAIMLFNYYMDWMSTMFFSFVALISSSVCYYSKSYMEKDKNFRLFMFLVMLFVISMFFMVFSLNLVSMMLGWDGLGVISYILVIYYKNEKSSSSGMITALSNRVGDAALLLSVACFLEMGSWNYMFMNYINSSWVYWLIVLAAITKSAQIPFSAWLPAAMAAPTPVSALVHSSTLVTAGVYLLIRFSDLFKSLIVMNLLIYLGMMTTVMASIVALFEVDFKKVVALSTLSQLGIMMTTLSFGFANLAFIHLLTHAVFKALLFMCSGKVIHNISGYQDIRKMGGLFFNLPVTSMLMNLSSFALCGVPFLSGFYSKDLIIENILMLDNFFFNYVMFTMIVGLSASYSFRLVYFSLVNCSHQLSVSVSCEKDWVMLKSKLGLMVMAIMSGSLLIWLVLPTPYMMSMLISFKLLTLCSMLLGVLVGLSLSFLNFKSLFLLVNLDKVITHMMLWNLPILFGSSTVLLSKFINREFLSSDMGWYEAYSGQGFNFMFLKNGEILMVLLKNSMKSFLMIFILSILLYF
uniref:NADH-ubiquinone oxidoreductase chain 5 n=1 Tax=Mongoloniscus sinensis TaxID=1783568 RepID=A0A3G3LKQ6_9CRUS|nr:NADH dehydrogenase subunit 5 [Mongoloniscus sinensis]AYQ93274.1 NADH dehydrogenase subunit 5 [Mongoloniscus sinensis]